jgi:hypothetical protein
MVAAKLLRRKNGPCPLPRRPEVTLSTAHAHCWCNGSNNNSNATCYPPTWDLRVVSLRCLRKEKRGRLQIGSGCTAPFLIVLPPAARRGIRTTQDAHQKFGYLSLEKLR